MKSIDLSLTIRERFFYNIQLKIYNTMIELKFNTANHTLYFTYRDVTKHYENVVTIKTHDDYYEVLQRQSFNDKNAPLFRVPISSTIIEFEHE